MRHLPPRLPITAVAVKILLAVCWITPLLLSRDLLAAVHGDNAVTLNITNPTFDAKAAELISKIRDKYQLESLHNVAKGTSTAQALSTMGAGNAYASGDYTFLVGGGAGVAIGAGEQTLNQALNKLGDLGGDTLPRFGIGTQVSALVGVNMSTIRGVRYVGPFELSRLTVLANFFDIKSNAISGLNLAATVAGLHAQYQIRRPNKSGALIYGEILWNVGFDYSRLSARYDSNTGKALTPITVGGGTPSDPQLTWNPAGVMQVTSGSGTLPVELATSVRVLWALSLYLGGGVDFQLGRASAEVDLAGNLTGSTGTPVSAGTATVKSQVSAAPQFMILRGFTGLQFNLVPTKSGNMVGVFAQGSITSVAGLAVQAGLRCAF